MISLTGVTYVTRFVVRSRRLTDLCGDWNWFKKVAVTIRERSCASPFTRLVRRESRLRQAVTHSAKRRQWTESHFNLKHRPVGVGSAEPTNHVSHDDVTPFFMHEQTSNKRLKKKTTTTYRSYWERHPCLSSHVWTLSKKKKKKKDDQFWSVFSSSFRNLLTSGYGFFFFFFLVKNLSLALLRGRSRKRGKPAAVCRCRAVCEAVACRSHVEIGLMLPEDWVAEWQYQCTAALIGCFTSGNPHQRNVTFQAGNHQCDASLNIRVSRNIVFYTNNYIFRM